MNKKLKQNTAITLIALVITIIVLLILAAVTLNIVLGENGLFTKARNAKIETEKAQYGEELQLFFIDAKTEYIAQNNEIPTIKELCEYVYTNKSSKIDMAIVYKQIANITINDTETQEPDYVEITYKNYLFTMDANLNITARGEQTGSIVIPTNPGGEEPQQPVNSIAGKTASTSNRTLSGATTGYSFKNPVIPQGFSAIDTTAASWTYKEGVQEPEVTGWNDGLVISDGTNEFVWVPVNGTVGGTSTSTSIVDYSKWCTDGFRHSSCSDSIDMETKNGVTYKSIPVENENAQITTYGGFYVARYEAGSATLTLSSTLETPNNRISTPVSTKGVRVWNNISYDNAYKSANLMINNSETYGNVKSGLITGTQWDTIMKWYKNSNIGIGTKDGIAQDWGSYLDNTYTIQLGDFFRGTNSMSSTGGIQAWESTVSELIHNANFNGATTSNPSHFHAAGLNSGSYKKNIADMAGNLSEWTSEKETNDADRKSQRDGSANSSKSIAPAARRSMIMYYSTSWGVGFRCVLYIPVD